MKKNYIIRKLLCLLLLFLLCSIHAQAAREKQIFDQSGLMNDREISAITEKANELREKYQMNFVILTTDDAGGKTAMEYADDFYMDQGFYDNDEKGGATFLIDMDNRELWIGTAGDMRYFLTDERIEQVIDAGYSFLRDKEYYDCFEQLLEQTRIFLEKGIPSDQYTYDTETGEIVRYRSIRPIEALIALIAALAAGGIACALVVGKYRLKWGTYKYPFREKSKLTLTGKEDRFMNQVVTTRHIPRNPPPGSGGGGGGGRSSTHTSGGGGNFGGGGRKF